MTPSGPTPGSTLNTCADKTETLNDALIELAQITYESANLSIQEFQDWLKGVTTETVCTRKTVGRVVLGILTGGGSEIACRSINIATDATALRVQLESWFSPSLWGSVPRYHLLENGYMPMYEELSMHADDVFCAPIWWPHQAELGELGPCAR